MAEGVGPNVFTIPSHRAFADALAAGLIARSKGDRLALARTTILLPNNRAQRTLTDAFVRRAEGGGLLLPRMIAIGDPELDDRLGAALDPVGEADPVPPAIEPIERQLILARLVQHTRAQAGESIDAAEAMRLAADLARVIDQLLVEEVRPARLREVVVPELAQHWQASLAILETVPFTRKERRHRCDELLHQFGIDRIAKNTALTLSGGEKRRLTIARSLVTQPQLLMLDEPFSGVDPIAVYDVQQLVVNLRKSGLAILITDHNVRETLSIVDRAYLIDEGRVVSQGTKDFLINDPISRQLYLGERFRM